MICPFCGAILKPFETKPCRCPKCYAILNSPDNPGYEDSEFLVAQELPEFIENDDLCEPDPDADDDFEPGGGESGGGGAEGDF